MKKSLLALAVLGAFAGVASAQSSVTLSGTVDINGRYVKNDTQNRRVSEGTDGINSSQLVFSGTEDLGGGLYAGFELNSGVNPDNGTANSKFWNRRSILRLWGNFGEIRLGRDYTPTFWNYTIFDAFGTNGLGNSLNVAQIGGVAPLGSSTLVRADNTIGYFLPANIGGVYGQVMAAASENASGNAGRYLGGRVGFAGGPVNVAVAFGEQRIDAIAGTPQEKSINVGGSYDLGVVKLLGWYDRETLSYSGADLKDNRFSLSAVVPVGQGEIHGGYHRSKLSNGSASNTINEIALGYVYNLSKRTAMYTTVARLSNGNGSAAGLPGGNGNTGLGGKSSGVEFGLRHFF